MENKTAIVTGAARGIGLATTRLLLGDGYNVAMVDRDEAELTKASDDLGNVKPLFLDISQPAAADKMISDARKPEILAMLTMAPLVSRRAGIAA